MFNGVLPAFSPKRAASGTEVPWVIAGVRLAARQADWRQGARVQTRTLAVAVRLENLTYRVQPFRYSVWVYWFTSGAFFTFRFLLSHSSRVPGARIASTPRSTVSVSDPE